MLRRFLIFDHTFFRFAVVGIINTLAGSALIFFLNNVVQLGYWLSSACGYAFVSVLSFFLNKYITFNVRHWSVFMAAAFAVNIAVCYFTAYVAAKTAVNFLLNQAPQKIRETLALLAGMCLFTGLNYIGQRFIVFKKEYV